VEQEPSAVEMGHRDDEAAESTIPAGAGRPPAGPEPGGEEREFTDAVLAFLTVARRTRGRMQPLFRDVTVPQLVLMDGVQLHGVDGVGAIAEYTGLSQPTVTRGAAALERAGLIHRAPVGEDGRRQVLSLTDRGRTLLDRKRSTLAEHFTKTWNELDPQQRDLAVPLLRHLADLVERLV
jgi:DNA-binding MarR family transcriptional regulator